MPLFNPPFIDEEAKPPLGFNGGLPNDVNPWIPSGTAQGGTIPTGTVTPNTGIQNPFSQQFDPFNLPMFQGPMAAPITEGQFSALEGIKKSLGADPFGNTNNIMAAIQNMVGGGGFAPPGMDANQVMARFRPKTEFSEGLSGIADTGLQTLSGYDPTNTAKSNSLMDSIMGKSFDNTELFKNMDAIFEDELAKQTAELREGYSGLGLGEGSSDRLEHIASNAGGARAKFNVGKAGIAKESFDDQLNRQIQLIPQVMANEQLPFAEKMQFVQSVLEPAAQRRLQATTTGAQLDENAMDRYMQEQALREQVRGAGVQAGLEARGQDRSGAMNLFNTEGILRNAADDEVVRNINEFARTQGGGLDQILKFIQSLSPQDAAVGPSTVSQVGNVAGQIVNNLPELIEGGKVIWDGARQIWDWAT